MADKLSLKWIDGNDLVAVPGTTTSVHISGYTEQPTFNVDDPTMWTPLSVLSGLASGFCERRAVLNDDFAIDAEVTSHWIAGTSASRDTITKNCMNNMAAGIDNLAYLYYNADASIKPLGSASTSNYMTVMDAAITTLVSGTNTYIDGDGSEYASTGRAAFDGVASSAHATANSQTETGSSITMPTSNGGTMRTVMANALPVEWAKERKWMLDELKYTSGVGNTVPDMSIDYYGFSPDTISSSYSTAVSASVYYTGIYSSATTQNNLETNSFDEPVINYTLSDGKIETLDTHIPAFILSDKDENLQMQTGLCIYTDCAISGTEPAPVWNEKTDYQSAVISSSIYDFEQWPSLYIQSAATISAFPGLAGVSEFISSTMVYDTDTSEWYLDDETASYIVAVRGGTLTITGTTAAAGNSPRYITGATVTLAGTTIYTSNNLMGTVVSLAGSAVPGSSSLILSSSTADGSNVCKVSCSAFVVDSLYRVSVDSSASLVIDPSIKKIKELNIVDGGVVHYLETPTDSATLTTKIESCFYNYAQASRVQLSSGNLVYRYTSASSGEPAPLNYRGIAPTDAKPLVRDGVYILDGGRWTELPRVEYGGIMLMNGAEFFFTNASDPDYIVVSSGCALHVIGGGIQGVMGGGGGIYNTQDVPYNVVVLSGGTCNITFPGCVGNIQVMSGGTINIAGVNTSESYLADDNDGTFADTLYIQNGAAMTWPTAVTQSSGIPVNGGAGDNKILGEAVSSSTMLYLHDTYYDEYVAFAWQDVNDADDIWYTATVDDLKVGDVVYEGETIYTDTGKIHKAAFRLENHQTYSWPSVVNISGDTITVNRQQGSSLYVYTLVRYAAGDVAAPTPCWRNRLNNTGSDFNQLTWGDKTVNGYILQNNNSVISYSANPSVASCKRNDMFDYQMQFFGFNNFGLKKTQSGTLSSDGLSRGWNKLQPIEFTDSATLDIFGIGSTTVYTSNVLLCGTTVAADAVTNAHAAVSIGIPENALPSQFYGTSAIIPEVRNGCQILAIKPGLGGVMNHYPEFYVRQFPTQAEIDQATSSATTT